MENIKKLFYGSRKLWPVAQILRIGPRHIYENAGFTYIVYRNKIVLQKQGAYQFTKWLKCNPLSCSVDENGCLFFGDYKTKKGSRKASTIFKLCPFSRKLDALLTILGVRHIHHVECSKGELIFTTGDADEESGIFFYSYNNGQLSEIFSGNQNFRIIQPHVEEKSLYFGTDSPDGPNFFFYSDWRSPLRCLGSVESPVYYKILLEGSLYFFTFAEKAKAKFGIWRVSSNGITNVVSSSATIFCGKIFQYEGFKPIPKSPKTAYLIKFGGFDHHKIFVFDPSSIEKLKTL